MTTRSTCIIGIALILGCQPASEALYEIEGWAPTSEVSRYGPDELWEIINGAADAFLGYGFELLTVQDYAAGDISVSVQRYDMGSSLNAFGIYRTEAPIEEEALPIGTQAVVSPPYQALLLKDRYYLKVEALEGALDRATGAALLEKIADKLPGTEELPPALAALPRAGMVSGSERYAKQNLLGLAELDNAIHAAYLDESGRRYTAFVVPAVAGTPMDETWAILEADWQPIEHGGRRVLYREVPYSGLIGAQRADVGLLGVSNCEDIDQLLQRLDDLQ
jgi:hypothetical protein